jgi:hypothetical protein
VAIADADASDRFVLSGQEMEPALLRMLRVMFPHDRFPDSPYIRACSVLLNEAAADHRLLGLLLQGTRDLDALGSVPFGDLDEMEAVNVLERIEQTVFFQRVRESVCRSLYDDPEVRELLGYEGPSVHLGGYVDRGFDDLDWLPEPPL